MRARRPFVVTLSIVALVIVVAGMLHIGALSERVEHLEQDAEARNLDLRMLAGELTDAKTAADGLRSHVSRLEYEDWRDVVSDVRLAAGDVEQAIAKARSRIAYLQPD